MGRLLERLKTWYEQSLNPANEDYILHSFIDPRLYIRSTLLATLAQIFSKQYKPVRRTRINLQTRVRAGHLVLCRHHHTVVHQAILRPNREYGRRQLSPQLLKVCIEWRNVRIPTTVQGRVGHKSVYIFRHDVTVEDEEFVKVVGGRQEAGKIVGAKIEDETFEGKGAAGLEEVKGGEQGKMTAGGLVVLYQRTASEAP